MRIEQRVIGACHTNVYLLISERNNGILIDPADDAEFILHWIRESGVFLKYIFLTHGHADHVLALREVKEANHVPVIISVQDAERLRHPDLINERPYVKVPFEPFEADLLVNVNFLKTVTN